MALQSFQDALDSVRLPEGVKPSILLANGFSQAWDTEIFNYKTLLQKADFGERDSIVRDVFDRFETYDFEQVMRHLETAELLCKIYNVDTKEIDEIRFDQEQLKESLIGVISNTHPARSSHVANGQYERAKPFILQFDSIFTLNYDLLLYWIINKTEIAPRGYGTYDGFSYDIWENRQDQNVYFLHGGLHLYNAGARIQKHVFNNDNDVSIVDKVRINLEQGLFPLFVSEPTHQKKLEKIRHNPYLNHCYKSLNALNGVLFIHGHSMAENDRHIFDQINNSNVERVFVSIFGDENSTANRETMANARRFINKNIAFYNAISAHIWG